MRGRLVILRAPSRAFKAKMTEKQPAVQKADPVEKANMGRHDTLKTKAAMAPNAGDSAPPSAMPSARAHAPTSAVSAMSTNAVAPRPIPMSSYNANSRLRRRSRNRLAYRTRKRNTSTVKTENACRISPALPSTPICSVDNPSATR